MFVLHHLIPGNQNRMCAIDLAGLDDQVSRGLMFQCPSNNQTELTQKLETQMNGYYMLK